MGRRLRVLLAGVAVLVAACGAPPPEAATIAAPRLRSSATPLAPQFPTAEPTRSARAVTEAGCCSRHWWSADSARVLFIDDPKGEAPLGIYAVETDGDVPRLLTTSLTGEDLLVEDAPPVVRVMTEPTQAFRLPSDADNAMLSPQGASVAWTTGSTLPVNVDRRQRVLWVTPGQTASPRRLAILTGGDLIGWSEDGQAVLATGRVTPDDVAGIWRLPIDGTPPSLLAEAERPRAARLSPSGRWLAYYLAFETAPERNGLWILATSGGTPLRIPDLGSYRWGLDERLYYIPFDPDDLELSLATFDPETGDMRTLLEGGAFPGGIAGNDWSLSPDGRWAAYRSAADAALWILPLPGG